MAPCTTGDVWVHQDRYMLMARRSQGFTIIDTANPSAPVSVDISPPGYPAGSQSYGVGDVKSNGRYLFASNESSGGGVFVYDLLPNPMAPTFVTQIVERVINRGVHNMWVEGNTLYCVSNRTSMIEVYDISTITNATHIATLGTTISNVFAHDVIVKDNVAYCSFLTGGLALYDVTTPSNPSLMGSVNYSNSFTHNAWPSPDRRFVYTTDENSPSGVGGAVRIWDVSNLSNFVQVGAYKTGANSSIVHNVWVEGDLLFVSYYKEGVRVASLKNPANPVEIASYDTFLPTGAGCFPSPNYAGCWGIYPLDPFRFYVSDLDSGGYMLRFTPVPHTLTVNNNNPAPGQTVTLSLTYNDATPAAIDSAAALALTKIGPVDVFSPVAIESMTLNPNQSRTLTFSAVVPAGLPSGITVEFTAYSGTVNPVTIGQETVQAITLQ